MTFPIEALQQHIAIVGKTGSGSSPEPKRCIRCDTAFQPTRKYPLQRFCSRRCGLAAVNPPDHNATVSRQTAEKRGHVQRDRGDGKSYRKLNGRHEHRVVAEKKLGRPLRRHEVVHHIDGDIHNNAPENLQVMIQRNHMREHGLGVPGVRPSWEPWKGAKK